jgi:hypothetical protein
LAQRIQRKAERSGEKGGGMRNVRMRTTGAGPAGVMPAGAVILVSDELALRLVDEGWAQYVGKEKIDTEDAEESVENTEENTEKVIEEKPIKAPVVQRRSARKPRKASTQRTQS